MSLRMKNVNIFGGFTEKSDFQGWGGSPKTNIQRGNYLKKGGHYSYTDEFKSKIRISNDVIIHLIALSFRFVLGSDLNIDEMLRDQTIYKINCKQNKTKNNCLGYYQKISTVLFQETLTEKSYSEITSFYAQGQR